ncbi:hypothetical protein CVN76_18990 [Bacillus sp. mrc49]|nr:hypothetical protein CVN76_18990 [Bacillus sp. mrc49]
MPSTAKILNPAILNGKKSSNRALVTFLSQELFLFFGEMFIFFVDKDRYVFYNGCNEFFAIENRGFVHA